MIDPYDGCMAQPTPTFEFIVTLRPKGQPEDVFTTKVQATKDYEAKKAALEAQLCSSIGKSLPSDFQFSQEEKDSAWNRAYDSVQGQAKTFNEKIPGWIKKARADWVEQHGSLKGLNRYALLALTRKYVELDITGVWLLSQGNPGSAIREGGSYDSKRC